MKFVSARQWGANDARNATPSSHPMHNARGVSLHWVGPGRGGSWAHSRCAGMVRAIERHHEYGNGWGDIAYNALVCPHGYVYEGRGANVRSAANGGTASNATHYAVCYLGGVGDPFTDAAKAAFVDAVRWLRSEGNAGPEVNGHRDHKATTCPGDVIYTWLKGARFDNTPTRKDWLDMATEKQVRAIVREEVQKGLDGILDADMNIHEPKGGKAFRGVTLREAVKELVREVRALRADGGAK